MIDETNSKHNQRQLAILIVLLLLRIIRIQYKDNDILYNDHDI